MPTLPLLSLTERFAFLIGCRPYNVYATVTTFINFPSNKGVKKDADLASTATSCDYLEVSFFTSSAAFNGTFSGFFFISTVPVPVIAFIVSSPRVLGLVKNRP